MDFNVHVNPPNGPKFSVSKVLVENCQTLKDQKDDSDELADLEVLWPDDKIFSRTLDLLQNYYGAKKAPTQADTAFGKEVLQILAVLDFLGEQKLFAVFVASLEEQLPALNIKELCKEFNLSQARSALFVSENAEECPAPMLCNAVTDAELLKAQQKNSDSTSG